MAGSDRLSEQTIKKLSMASAFLRTVPEERFDIRVWSTHDSCGFAGCAVGWFIHAKLFDGLKWWSPGGGGARPAYNGKTNFDAIDSLFEIEPGHAEYLFTEDNHNNDVTPAMVAERIDEYIKSDGVISKP